MMACVVLYGNTDTEMAATYSLRVRDLQHAIDVAPQCAAQHRWRCGADCQLTDWTVSIVDPVTHLFKIAATGAIDHEPAAGLTTETDGVARRDSARGDGD